MLGLAPFEKRDFDIFSAMNDFDRNFFGDRMNRMLNEPSFSKFRTDISETDNGYLLEAELPGFKKEDISIDIDKDCLTISAERKSEEEEEDKESSFVRRERYYGSFRRSFNLKGIDAENITASYTDGILTLTMPEKAPEIPAARRLEIQ